MSNNHTASPPGEKDTRTMLKEFLELLSRLAKEAGVEVEVKQPTA